MTSKSVVLSALTVAGIAMIVTACANTHEMSQELIYSKDNRTNLCFASRNLLQNNAIMTNVPCTPEVLFLISK